MPVLRTPDERFVDLPDYPFAPNYLSIPHRGGKPLRMHYVDEAPAGAAADAPVVLLLHGEPTWSFLYRKMIPILVDAGMRAIAPDHIGFGRSDKPTDVGSYTYENHVRWNVALLRALDLRDVILFCQDWGGPIGLSLVAEEHDRFSAVMAANTILPTAQAPPEGEVDGWPGEVIEAWIETSRSAPRMPVGQIIGSVSPAGLSDDVIRAYDAPFPDESYKAGVRAFPQIIPVTADDLGALHNRAVWSALRRFEKPFVTAFSDADPTTAAWAKVFQERVPGARDRSHSTVRGGHFLQEESGGELARLVIELKAHLDQIEE